MLNQRYSNLLVFLLIIVTVFLFHSSALNFNFAYQEYYYLVNATANNFSDAVGRFGDYFSSAEFRPLHHYIYFLLQNKLFGDNYKVFRLIVLLLHCFNIFFIYVLISKITKNKRIAFFSIFVFLTRIAVLRSFYVTLSPPKLCFFILLTFIFYLKSAEKKSLYLSLSVLCYILAMFIRETFVFLPVAIAGYEVIFTFDSKITLKNLKTVFMKVVPYLAVIAAYITIRIPFFLQQTSAPYQGGAVKISYKTLSMVPFLLNLANLIRFNYNALTVPIATVGEKDLWLSLVDVVFYLTLIVLGHCIYSLLVNRELPSVLKECKKPILWGSLWFFVFIFIYCFFDVMGMDHLYEGIMGICLIVAALGDYYYKKLVNKRVVIGYSIACFFLLHSFLGFYVYSRHRIADDDYLMSWAVASDYAVSVRKSQPSIPAGASVHLYGQDVEKRRDVVWDGYMFKYLYNNKELNVVFHELQPDKTKIGSQDIVFRMEKDKLINDTPVR